MNEDKGNALQASEEQEAVTQEKQNKKNTKKDKKQKEDKKIARPRCNFTATSM